MGRDSDLAACKASQTVDRDEHGGATRASRGMSIRGVVFDFWIDEHALRNFTSAGASDWPEMEHRAWDHVVHNPALRHAVHGGNRAGAIWAYRPGVWHSVRSANPKGERACVRGSHRTVHCELRGAA